MGARKLFKYGSNMYFKLRDYICTRLSSKRIKLKVVCYLIGNQHYCMEGFACHCVVCKEDMIPLCID